MKICAMALIAMMTLATPCMAQVQIIARAHAIADYIDLYSCGSERLSAYVVVNGETVIDLPDTLLQAGDTYRLEADVLSTTLLKVASTGAVIDMVPPLDSHRWLCRTSGPEAMPGTYNPDHWLGAHCGGPGETCDFQCDEATAEEPIGFGSLKVLYR